MNFEELIRLAARRRSDGAAPVRRVYGIEIKADSIDIEKRSVRVIASTDSIDSYDDIVEQDWDFSRFDKNPVCLWLHNINGIFGMGGNPEWMLPIGYCTDYGVVKGRLEATLNFVNEKANPLAENVWQGFIQKSIRAVSVGFYPRTVTRERKDDQDYYRLSDNELWEISPVPLPANPDAVALSADVNEEREWLRQRAAGTKTDAAKAAQENQMNLEEQIKKLQAELDAMKSSGSAKDTEVSALKEQVASLKASLESANKRADEETGKRKTAEEQLQSKTVSDADQAIDAEVQALVGVKLRAEQKDTFVKLRKESPDTFKSIIEGMPDLIDQKAIEAEVDALVGKKLTPALKGPFVQLRKLAPELFAEITKNMVDLPHALRVTPPDPHPTKSKADGKIGPSKIVANASKS